MDDLPDLVEAACLRLLEEDDPEVTASEVAREIEADVDARQVGRVLSLSGVYEDKLDRISLELADQSYTNVYRIRRKELAE